MAYLTRIIVAAAIAIVVGSPVTASATAAGAAFDGQWNVRIASSSSECGDGQTVSIGISNGQVSSSMVSASGRVVDAGSITVTLSNGLKRAIGFGRLSGVSGSGTWHGALCKGTWTASRI